MWDISPSSVWGTGICGLMRRLAPLPQDAAKSLSWSKTKMKDPQEEAHCFCKCGGGM